MQLLSNDLPRSLLPDTLQLAAYDLAKSHPLTLRHNRAKCLPCCLTSHTKTMTACPVVSVAYRG